MKFICDMSIVQIYLVKWGEKRTLATPLLKFCEKVGKRRDKWCDGCERKKGISVMILPKKKKLNYGNWITEIGGLKKEKKKSDLWQE